MKLDTIEVDEDEEEEDDEESDNDDDEEGEDEDMEDEQPQLDPKARLASKLNDETFGPLLRSKGFLWLATRPRMVSLDMLNVVNSLPT
jgi:G3E family GTPase